MLQLTSHLLKRFLWVTAACIFCYFFVDKPIAIFMYKINNFFYGGSTLGNANLMSNLTTASYLIIILFMAWYAYERVFQNKNTRFVRCIGITTIAAGTAFFIKTNLQFFFGRIGPRYNDNQSLLFSRHDTLYGFHLFQGGGSFPSGHMCVFTAMLLTPCYFYPHLRKLAYTLLGILAFLLIFGNYHFVSDVISGTYLGAFIAMTLYQLNKLNAPRSGRDAPAAAIDLNQNEQLD